MCTCVTEPRAGACPKMPSQAHALVSGIFSAELCADVLSGAGRACEVSSPARRISLGWSVLGELDGWGWLCWLDLGCRECPKMCRALRSSGADAREVSLACVWPVGRSEKRGVSGKCDV